MTAITEFIQQLREFGTGAYLRPEERQYWEPPFDVNALPELEALLIGYAKSVPFDVPNPTSFATMCWTFTPNCGNSTPGIMMPSSNLKKRLKSPNWSE